MAISAVFIYMQFNTKIGAYLLAFFAGLMLLAGLGQGVFANAQVTSASADSCLSLQGNVGYGASDMATGGAVSALQNFLTNQGYFSSVYLGTGHYGAITFKSVAKFQAAHGIRATGFVGPLTRAAIAQISCGTGVTPPSTTAANLYSVNPTNGPVGTSVSVTGFGFTNNNTVLVDGLLAARNVPIASSVAIACTTSPACHGGINQTLVFTMPQSAQPNCPIGSMCPLFIKEITPGLHTISIQNDNGTSNSLNFTVTGGAANNQTLTITGLNAPASLSLGQQGTWTVTAVSSGAGNLHYGVTWGDEAAYSNGIMAPQNTSVQSSATFTHAYSRSGTYAPVFTVTDDYGHSVATGNTIVVTPLY